MQSAGFWIGKPNCRFSAPEKAISSGSLLWVDIFGLFDCVFFTRLWVIQEVALARSVLLYLENCAIQWEWVGLASAIRYNYRIEGLAKPGRLETVPTGVPNAYFIYRISASQLLQAPLSFSLHQLLVLTRQFGCKDPRDRFLDSWSLPND
jgi:hypothetical protein